jgi:hypothetical protein
VIRGATFFVEYPIEGIEGDGFLSDWLIGKVGTQGFWATLTGIFVVFIQALMINIIVAKYRMATTISLLPGLFYALLVSLFPEFLVLTPALLANTFFILALWELYETYRKNEASGNIVNVGFWLGIASLFYFPEIAFILLVVFGLSVLRAFRLKEMFMLLIGFVIPYFWVGVYFFWSGQLDVFWQTYLFYKFSFFNFAFPWDSVTLVKVLVLGLLTLVVLFSLGNYSSKRSIQAQKNISVLYWSILVAAISFIIQSNTPFYHLLVIIVPVGTLISFNFIQLSARIAEALHLLLFAGILIWQFHPYWLR